MGYSTITQIALIVVSGVIIFSYITPTFAEIQETQDEVVQFADAVSKAAEFNQLLAELITIEQSISAADRQALERFLPVEVDHIQVMRDIENIAQLESVVIDSITTDENISPNDNVVLESGEVLDRVPVDHRDFSLVVTADYDQVKRFLSRLETNAYLIEIMSLNIGTPDANQPDPSGQNAVVVGEEVHSVALSLRVYAQNS